MRSPPWRGGTVTAEWPADAWSGDRLARSRTSSHRSTRRLSIERGAPWEGAAPPAGSTSGSHCAGRLRSTRISLAAVVMSVSLPPESAPAWGGNSHRVVALIAERHLTNSCPRAQIRRHATPARLTSLSQGRLGHPVYGLAQYR
jgi:hypothetical protein